MVISFPASVTGNEMIKPLEVCAVFADVDHMYNERDYGKQLLGNYSCAKEN